VHMGAVWALARRGNITWVLHNRVQVSLSEISYPRNSCKLAVSRSSIRLPSIAIRS